MPCGCGGQSQLRTVSADEINSMSSNGLEPAEDEVRYIVKLPDGNEKKFAWYRDARAFAREEKGRVVPV